MCTHSRMNHEFKRPPRPAFLNELEWLSARKRRENMSHPEPLPPLPNVYYQLGMLKNEVRALRASRRAGAVPTEVNFGPSRHARPKRLGVKNHRKYTSSRISHAKEAKFRRSMAIQQKRNTRHLPVSRALAELQRTASAAIGHVPLARMRTRPASSVAVVHPPTRKSKKKLSAIPEHAMNDSN